MELKHVVLISVLVLIPILLISGCTTQAPLTVGELLANPVYNTTVTIQGNVSFLHEVMCTCFGLTSGDEALWVWYDTMYDYETNTQWPAVSVDDIENGDWVIMTGQLQEWWNPEISPDFWAISITKSTAPTGS